MSNVVKYLSFRIRANKSFENRRARNARVSTQRSASNNMNKEFTRKNKKLQFILLCACGLIAYFFCVKVLVTENLLSQDMIYIAISLIIPASIFYILLGTFLDLNTKVTINNSSIIIKKSFKVVELKWSEIIECKKHEKGFGVWAGWRYSLNYNRNGEKQIVFADNNIENMQELIDSIFKLAVAAKFIEIRNDSLLPFFKNYKTSEWRNG